MTHATAPTTLPVDPNPLRVASPWVVYPTAFLEGASVIVVEIAGARALAPFFGTSLQVWTAQITVTLLFLALGYGLGGLLARRIHRATMPLLFGLAGAWLAIYPVMRTPMLDFASQNLGVALGSLLSAAMLFGVPLLLMGAVSPVLIAYIDNRRPGAGSAAGRLFFTNTMGGLAGGWLTAFALIPHTSLRLSLVATGILLVVLGLIWGAMSRSRSAGVVAILLIAAVGVTIVYQPSRTFTDKYGQRFEVLHSHQSGIGLIQVLDFGVARVLMINGVNQGEKYTGPGRGRYSYIDNLHALSHSHHPNAKTALQLGLGAGLTPSLLARRGLEVTAVEIEPRMVELARQHFGLPDSVKVHIGDGRSFLRRDTSTYDLIFLDTFASESTAWYLLTTEAMQEMKARLNPGGRLVINTVAYSQPERAGLSRIESTVLAAFGEAMVYPEKPNTDDPEELINATLVAGDNLDAKMVVPSSDYTMTMLATLLANGRPARDAGDATTDDRSDLDYVQAPMRIHWRTLIWDSLHSNLLWD